MSDENICKSCKRQINPTDEDSYFHSARQRQLCQDEIVLQLYNEFVKGIKGTTATA